jgi:hypothetical protein
VQTIYEIDPGVLFDYYKQHTGLQLCPTCWTDRVKAYNYYRKMTKSKTKTSTSTSGVYQFKEGFEDTQVFIKGLGEIISAENLTNELVEQHFVGSTLMDLVELSDEQV